MKRILTILIITLMFLVNGAFSYAVTSPSPTPTKTQAKPTITPVVTDDADQEKLEKIKDLIASEAARRNLVDRRGIIGTVKSTTNTQIKLVDNKNKERQIDIDELTKFEGGSDEDSFGISDIKQGDVLSSIGLYYKESGRLLARFISRATNIPQNIEGIVASKDAKNFTIDVVGDDGKRKTVSIETSTKTVSYEDGESVKAGFSKILPELRVIVVGFMDPKIKDQLNASRIIVLVSIPPTNKMKQFANTLNQDVPVSTGSAGKVAPIIK